MLPCDVNFVVNAHLMSYGWKAVVFFVPIGAGHVAPGVHCWSFTLLFVVAA